MFAGQIKNVDMFRADLLDDNTLIDKNTFEVPVFNEIIEKMKHSDDEEV